MEKQLKFQVRDSQDHCPMCGQGLLTIMGFHVEVEGEGTYCHISYHCISCSREFEERFSYDRSFYVPTEVEVRENNNITC
jgi:hypothetical protein